MIATLHVQATGTLPPGPPRPRSIRFKTTITMPTGQFGYRGVPGVTMRAILETVARRYNLSMERLRGPQRVRDVAWARQEAMWIMYETGRWSLPQIGRFLGDRDHTTVLHGVRAYAARMAAKDVAEKAAWRSLRRQEVA